MYFLVTHHVLYHGGPMYFTKKLSYDNNLLLYLNTIFCSGVDTFGMISGLVGFHSHKYSKLLYLLCQAFLYGYGIAYYLKLKNQKNVKDLNQFLYPVFIPNYWYFNAYFIVYFFFPFINAGIKYLGKREIGIFNLTLFLLFSCFNQISHYSKRLNFDMFALNNGFTYKWLLILYFLGSYFGRFYSESHKYNIFIIFILCSVIIGFVAYFRNLIIIYKIKNKQRYGSLRYEYTAPSSVIISTCFISFFSKVQINSAILQRIISLFSSVTFGIYLIHGHPLVLTRVITGRYNFLSKYHSKDLILGILFESLKVFLFCSILDFIRLVIFKILRIRQICDLIEIIFNKILNFIIIIFEYLY